ncbi:general substrate transporter [Dactylonectria macrodidyma]|uniref:General substrate transporter n=1 Tax=Dactylonectria macrodidyma TaxID=307937 RepID=A0A9P9EBW0_9HYPO|nr:general substrate transporter [Dactylonectria macrodidyma]
MLGNFIIDRPQTREAGAVWFPVILGVFVAFGGVLYGYDTGIISGILAMRYWRDLFSTGHRNPNDGELDVTSSQSSLIVSILSVGTFFGALLAAPLADRLGRRLSLCIGNVIFVAGVTVQTASTTIPTFTAGRCLAGFGVGVISAIIPLYQSETAPKRLRGTIVGTYQLSITIGLLLAAIVNNATKGRNDSGSYRIPVAIQFLWSIILFTGTIFLPETPRYLVKRGKLDKAMASLSRLRRLPAEHPALEVELREIRENHEYEMSLCSASWAACYRGDNLKRLLISCTLQALQQLTGVNFVFYYGTAFFRNSGVENPFIISMITSCINTISTLPGLWAVEKLGRRQLLLIGAAGMGLCQLVVAIVGTVDPSSSGQKVLVAFVCVFIFFFASTWGIGAWVVTSELFSLKVRAKCLAQSVATNWLFNWALGYATPYLVDSGPGNAGLGAKVFFIWGGSCCVGFAFTYFFIYETKGLGLEEVDELFLKVKNARESTTFVPTSTLASLQDSQSKVDKWVHPDATETLDDKTSVHRHVEMLS